MSRLIDTLTDAEVRGRLSPFFDVTFHDKVRGAWLTEELENLFAEEPHWSDNLDPADNQTWVLCYLSDDSAEETWNVEWVYSRTLYGEGYRDCEGGEWKYATPVDLNVRYKRGEE